MKGQFNSKPIGAYAQGVFPTRECDLLSMLITRKAKAGRVKTKDPKESGSSCNDDLFVHRLYGVYHFRHGWAAQFDSGPLVAASSFQTQADQFHVRFPGPPKSKSRMIIRKI